MVTLKRIAPALGLAGLIGLAAQPAAAQSACASRDKIVTTLGSQYKEAPAGIGLMQPGRVMELLVSHSGSWTLIVTTPDGMSCVVAAGENWDQIPVPPSGRAA